MRAGLKSSLIMQQESSMSRSGSLASDWFYLGRVRSLDEISAALDALTPESVSAYAAGQDLDDLTILTLGPNALTCPRREASGPAPPGSGSDGRVPQHLEGEPQRMRFHHTVLDNGLQVIAELNDQAHSVACGFFVKTGSRDESTEVAGVSHFLEHMVFKGTPRRDALAVNRDFDRVGAKHNAQTSEEDTFYHVTCLPEYLPQAVRRPVRHPPPDPPRGRLRHREEGDHRRDPDVPG